MRVMMETSNNKSPTKNCGHSPGNPIGLVKVDELMKQLGIDKRKLQKEIKSMMEDSDMLEERLQQFSNMVNDPKFRASLKDPQKLEMLRQTILNNRTIRDIKAKK